MLKRMLRAAGLDSELYEEVEADPNYTGEATLIVLGVALISSLGMALAYDGDSGIRPITANVLSSLVSWLGWAILTLWIGKNITKAPTTQSDLGEMLRTLGYAHVPQVLVFFVFIPGAGPVIALVGSAWKLTAAVVAIRQALDFSTGRAITTALLGYLAVLAFRMLVRFVF